MEKVKTTIRQFYRDWSAEVNFRVGPQALNGLEFQHSLSCIIISPLCSCYRVQLNDPCATSLSLMRCCTDFPWTNGTLTLLQHLPLLPASWFVFHSSIARDVSILVPGAGLGRLAHEFAQRGYSCQGNEFSMYMLLASNFILNE